MEKIQDTNLIFNFKKKSVEKDVLKFLKKLDELNTFLDIAYIPTGEKKYSLNKESLDIEAFRKILAEKIDLEIDHSHESNLDIIYDRTVLGNRIFFKLKDSCNCWKVDQQADIFIAVYNKDDLRLEAWSNSKALILGFVPDIVRFRLEKVLKYIADNSKIWIPKIDAFMENKKIEIAFKEFSIKSPTA